MMLRLVLKEWLFDCLCIGTKALDVRLNSPAKSRVVCGDFVQFNQGKRTKVRQVIGIRTYPSFEAMLEAENFIPIMPMVPTKERVLRKLREQYGTRDTEKGVIVFEFSRTP